MRPRGTALAIAITCVLLVAVVGALLARSGAARTQARRADVQREAALRRAESALEAARLALESGRLKAGAQMTSDGLTVQCAGLKDAVLLTTEAEAPLAPGTMPSSLRRLLRVSWTMKQTAQTWQRTAWSADFETQSLQTSGPKVKTK